MYEKLEECPSCGHTSFNNHLICKDSLVSEESFALVKCGKCQLVFTNPRPTKEQIGKYYNSPDYISHSNTANTPINLIYKLVRGYTTTNKYRLIKKYIKQGRLLDFGCGTGHFLSATPSTYTTFGYDQDSDALNIAQSVSGATILNSISSIQKEESFDIITAWHVIEHIHELKETIRLLRKKLSKDGFMFIAVPNIASYDAKIYGSNWAAYDVPRHLYHFNQSSFVFLLKKLKLQLIEVLPMKFDSYYVSMLTEKNKTTGSLLQGLKTGYISNKAAKDSCNYSSLIYVVSK
ncbi:MAG: class I SAM-dependent methyltransferase [Cyclobacteriaceae bacterium]